MRVGRHNRRIGSIHPANFDAQDVDDNKRGGRKEERKVPNVWLDATLKLNDGLGRTSSGATKLAQEHIDLGIASTWIMRFERTHMMDAIARMNCIGQRQTVRRRCIVLQVSLLPSTCSESFVWMVIL
jgi:hypothetical protein